MKSKPKDTMPITRVTLDGVEYWQPECHCKGGAHICYLRPVPQVVNVPMKSILKNLSGGSGLVATDSEATTEHANPQSKPTEAQKGTL